MPFVNDQPFVDKLYSPKKYIPFHDKQHIKKEKKFKYKIKKDLFAMLSAGSEVHRFPSELGETKLQMDYLILTLKRGLH